MSYELIGNNAWNKKMKRVSVHFFSIFTVFNLFFVACSPINVLPTPIPSALPDVSEPGECTKIGQTWASPIDGVTLVCVPAGEFLMGAADDDNLAQDDEKPQHKVYLDAYWIDSTEVTNVNFGKCLAADVCHPEEYETTANSYIPYSIHPEYQNHPALLYEPDVAADYCQWVGRRLPTEAEWEKAARGMDGRFYPWGNTLDCTRANYFSCEAAANKTKSDPTGPACGEHRSDCKTTQVNDYLNGASPYGALNMAGNMWEWVSDWYQADYYASSPMNNPGGPINGKYRVARGGGANSVSRELRVTERGSGAPLHYLDGQIGFRCALDASLP